MLLLPNDSVFALTEALALRCAITKPLALSSTVTELFALLLLTVDEQSFAVSKVRACLLLPHEAVVVLLSLLGIASELFWSVSLTGIRTTHDARTCALMPNKSVALSASACQVSLH